VALSQGVAMTMATQVKEGFYHDHYPTYIIFPFAIKFFWCLHKQFNSFFHRCAKMAWTSKGIGGLPLLM
jgi:hypothetical protein